jgi:hypothetical protein
MSFAMVFPHLHSRLLQLAFPPHTAKKTAARSMLMNLQSEPISGAQRVCGD